MDINRRTAYFTLLEIEKNSAYSNIELNRQIENSKPSSPAFVRELTYGVLENKMLLDYILEKLIPSGLRKVKASDLVLLRMGIYQIGYMNSVPEYAGVNESVLLAKKFCKGREGFINGVLRGYIRKKDEIALPDKETNWTQYCSIKYSFLPWIVTLWEESYGREETEKLLESSNQTPELYIRINLLKTTKQELVSNLETKGFEIEDKTEYGNRVIKIKGSGLLEGDEYKNGMFSVQDPASVMAAEILGPDQGDTVIDVCAAPGGKTLAMSEIMGNKGQILAFDVYEHKLDLIDKEAKRLGITIIKTGCNDGSIMNSDYIEKADKVLVDGPCSGLGVIRKKPEIKYKEVDLAAVNLPQKQLEILTVSSNYVKEDGIIVYSTCTINPKENEQVVKDFLCNNENFILISEKQFSPNRDGTDGFYICKMKRKIGQKGDK